MLILCSICVVSSLILNKYDRYKQPRRIVICDAVYRIPFFIFSDAPTNQLLNIAVPYAGSVAEPNKAVPDALTVLCAPVKL